jgi:RNA polymerase sigma factor for flagellar operon FliA
LYCPARVPRSTDRDELIHMHAPAARRIALRLARRCPDWIAREDLVAAGMLGLIEAAERYDHARREPFIAFAELRIRGAVLDELRRGDMMSRRARRQAKQDGQLAVAVEQLDGDDAHLADQGALPDAVAEQHVALRRVRGALPSLLPREVTILRLYYAEERTYQQIAAALGVTPSRVCQLLWRAVARLREQLGATDLQEAA